MQASPSIARLMTAAFIAFAKQNAHKRGQDKPAAVRERSESTAVNLHDVAGSMPQAVAAGELLGSQKQRAGHRTCSLLFSFSCLPRFGSRRICENERYSYDKEKIKDKIYGAWLGRICGCMLGKSVEGGEQMILFLF